MNTLEFRTQYRLKRPKYYHPLIHIVVNFGLLWTLFLLPLNFLENVLWWEWITYPSVLVLGSFVVFFVHKYPLHQPGIDKYAFRVHALEHHRFFTHEVITFDSWWDFYIVFFPIRVVTFFGLIVAPLLALIFSKLISFNVGLMSASGAAGYFLLYELFHFVSHLPQDHWILNFPFFRFMRQHHIYHHNPQLMAKYNFNIVLPIADYLFGSVYRYQKIEDEDKR